MTIVYDDIKYTREIETYEQKYIAVRMMLEQNKLLYNNPYFGDAYKQEIKWNMSQQIRRFGQYFFEEDAVAKSRETYMYGTEIVDSKGFEHVTPLGSDKAEETGRLNQFFKNEITVDELLFSPVCRVHKELDEMLRGKHVYLNEDPQHFFNRYVNAGFSGVIKTWRGDIVDLQTWDFNDHISQVVKPHPVWGSLWKKFAMR
jgi:hypothetical protein